MSPWRDAGGLDLEDVRGDGALGGDAHVAVDDGERQISTGGLVDRTHTAAGHAHRGVNSHSESCTTGAERHYRGSKFCQQREEYR